MRARSILPFSTMDSAGIISQWRLTSRIKIVLGVLALFLVVLLFFHFDIMNRSGRSTSKVVQIAPRNTYLFTIVADKDKGSRDGSLWKSILKRGTLRISNRIVQRLLARRNNPRRRNERGAAWNGTFRIG